MKKPYIPQFIHIHSVFGIIPNFCLLFVCRKKAAKPQMVSTTFALSSLLIKKENKKQRNKRYKDISNMFLILKPENKPRDINENKCRIYSVYFTAQQYFW